MCNYYVLFGSAVGQLFLIGGLESSLYNWRMEHLSRVIYNGAVIPKVHSANLELIMEEMVLTSASISTGLSDVLIYAQWLAKGRGPQGTLCN